MNSQQFPRRVEQDLSVQKLADETLVYDEHRHLAFCLDRVASAVWLQCDGSNTPAQIASKAGLPEEIVAVALAQFERDSLLQAAGTSYVHLAAVSRRSLMGKLGASAMLLLPVVTMLPTLAAAQTYTGCADCSTNAQQAKRNAVQAQPSTPAATSASPSIFKP